VSIDNIIEKVRKLRALAANAGTLAEAEAAAAQAEAIIARYRLEEAQLEIDDASRVEAVGVADEPMWVGGERVPSWLNWLATALARHYGCVAFSEATRTRLGTTKCFKVVGRPSDVQVVRYMFAWLSAEIDRLSYRERGRSAMNAFRLGAVEGICTTLATAQKQVEAEPGAGSAAMVLASRADEADAYANRVFNLRGRTSGISYYDETGAFARGRAAGEGIHLGDALDGGGGTSRGRLGAGGRRDHD
jgi:hypothetical protein